MRRRKCFLLVDTEMPESLSTRKLMLESVKFNVISVYSGEEALEEFERFPRVDGVILHSELSGKVAFCDVAGKIKSADPKMFVLVLAPSGDAGCKHADQVMSSHDPKGLVDFLIQQFGAEQEIKV